MRRNGTKDMTPVACGPVTIRRSSHHCGLPESLIGAFLKNTRFHLLMRLIEGSAATLLRTPRSLGRSMPMPMPINGDTSGLLV